MITFKYPTSMIIFPFQRQLIGSFFALICLIGIMVGVFRSRCSQILHFRRRNKIFSKNNQINLQETRVNYKGHHPVCEKFNAHVLQIGEKKYCAGCTGLVIGAVLALFGCFLYFFLDFYVEESGMFVFWLGFTGVFCGLLQYHIFNRDSGSIHFFLNVIFVMGAFLLLVGVNEITRNFFLEVYLLTSIIYWIIARIMLSQLEHKKICIACGLTPCSYFLDNNKI